MDTTRRTSSAVRITVALALALLTTTLALAPSALAAGSNGDSMRRTAVPDAGVSVAYPRSWVPFPTDGHALDRMKEAVARHNPKKARTLTQRARALIRDSVRLAVIDPESRATLVVMAVDLPVPGPDDVLDLERGLEAQGFDVGTTSFPEVAGTRAVRIELGNHGRDVAGHDVAIRAIEVLVPHGTGTTIIQVTAPESAHTRALFDMIVEGIRTLHE